MGNSSSFNVFENISIIGFKKGKTLQDILVTAKVPSLKRISVVPAISRDVKLVNILPKHMSLNNSLQNAYILPDHRI